MWWWHNHTCFLPKCDIECFYWQNSARICHVLFWRGRHRGLSRCKGSSVRSKLDLDRAWIHGSMWACSSIYPNDYLLVWNYSVGSWYLCRLDATLILWVHLLHSMRSWVLSFLHYTESQAWPNSEYWTWQSDLSSYFLLWRKTTECDHWC